MPALLAACCVLAGLPAGGAVFPELYAITVTPDPDALDRRAAAIRLAMGQLLTRITGRLDARSHPDLQPLIESAETHMRSYNPLDRERIRVEFIPSRVDQWLETVGWPVWGAERPMTLLWVAVDGGWGERAILSAGLADPFAVPDERMSPEMLELLRAVEEEIRLAADERGLPITLPIMDLQDARALTFVDVWGGFEQRVDAASSRYRAEAVLVARVRARAIDAESDTSEFDFEVSSTLVQGELRSVVSSGSLRDGLDWLANDFAAEFGMAGAARTLPLSVLDIGSLADYGAVMTYLEALSVLDAVEVVSLGGRVLDVLLTTRSEEDVLRRVLALDGVLLQAGSQDDPVPSIPVAPEPADPQTLTYRLAKPEVGQ